MAANTIGRTDTLTWTFDPIRTDRLSASIEKIPRKRTPGNEPRVSP
jgi:hypothetical protein